MRSRKRVLFVNAKELVDKLHAEMQAGRLNLAIGRWDELFAGQLAATATLDRLLHHCHVLILHTD